MKLQFKSKFTFSSNIFQRLHEEKAARLLRFSAAVYINLIAIRLQRAYRKARAIALFKAKIDRLVFLQVYKNIFYNYSNLSQIILITT